LRQSTLFGRTLRQAPADAQLASHKLLTRGGFARPVAAGIWTLLPLGHRVVRKIERIIREEMERIGCQELSMPILNPASLWQETGRWDELEPAAFRLVDHGGREFMIAFTHEEVVTAHAREEVLSYRQLPILVYHFQTKGRDEARPRGGLVRTREFVMKDSYSLDRDPDGLDVSYARHFAAYERVFRRVGVRAHAVESDTGAMGGRLAHEFQVLCEHGEDRLLFCPACDYRANVEKATRRIDDLPPDAAVGAPRTIPTPGLSTIEELVGSLGRPAERFLKTMLVRAGQELVACVLPGDRELNEAKLRTHLGVPDVGLATPDDFAAAGSVAGFAGPIGLRGARLLVDRGVAPQRRYVCGANRPDLHLDDVVHGRDFAGEPADLHLARAGDRCATCGTPMEARRGIEVGNIFKLGTRYSEAMGATFLDEDGTRKPLVMGSYGIGLGRLLATVVEEHHDERGIVWPAAVAPFDVHVLPLQHAEPTVREAADRLVADLERDGLDVLHDDRDDAPGAKFADADLLGIPLRVAVSVRSLRSASVELKGRGSADAELVPLAEAATRIKAWVTTSTRAEEPTP
jgi:prolyl-tRNA synthetase